MNGDKTTITSQSKVSVAILGAIFLVITGSVWSASKWATTVDLRLQNIEKDISLAVDLAQWVDRLRASNPTLQVPPVRK